MKQMYNLNFTFLCKQRLIWNGKKRNTMTFTSFIFTGKFQNRKPSQGPTTIGETQKSHWAHCRPPPHILLLRKQSPSRNDQLASGSSVLALMLIKQFLQLLNANCLKIEKLFFRWIRFFVSSLDLPTACREKFQFVFFVAEKNNC